MGEDCRESRILVIRTCISGSLVTSSKYQGLPAMIQNLPATAGDPGQEDPLEEEMETHSSILGESHGQRSLVGYSPKSRKELDMTEAT